MKPVSPFDPADAAAEILDEIDLNRTNLNAVLDQIEGAALELALRNSRGNQCEAASALGIKRTTFCEKLKRWRRLNGLEPLSLKRARPEWSLS